MQQDTVWFILLQNHSTCFGCPPHPSSGVDSSWIVMAHGEAREAKWRGNWRMECVASTLHTTLEHGVSSNTTADTHTSAASSRLNWRPRRFKLFRPFRRKTKSGFCACAITFQLASTKNCNRSLRYRSQYRYSYFPPTWPDQGPGHIEGK